MFKIGCHVQITEGIWKAPKKAHSLGCETFQIFTRPPQGGKAGPIDDSVIERFKIEMHKNKFEEFVVHTPYFINFGSANNRVYYGSIAVVKQELERANLLGAKYVMTHLGSGKDLGIKRAIKQTQDGLKKVLTEYQGKTQLLLEISAGAGEIIGDTFEELAEIMAAINKYKAFGGICFDTQHAFASGYDLRNDAAVISTFEKFNKIIGLKWLKMSHLNDSQADIGSHKDQHTNLGEGKIGEEGFGAFLGYLSSYLLPSPSYPSPKGRGKSNKEESMLLILETGHDKVKADIKILKFLRNKIYV